MTRRITPTYTPITQITLAAATNSVTISNIPQNFADLILVTKIRPASNSLPGIRFNGDTGNSYPYIVIVARQSDAIAGSATVNNTYLVNNTSSSSGTIDASVHIMDYSQIDKHKSVLTRFMQTFVDNRSDWTYVGAQASRWSSTNAITSITVNDTFYSGNVIGAGSTFYLYGVVA